jgi:drug/metabolite transporter (DMT)-like permease
MDPSADGRPATNRAIGIWYLFLLALANLMWAAQGSAVKVLEGADDQSHPHLGPIAITFLPFYVTTLLLIGLLIWRRRREPAAVRPTWGDWKKFVVAGIGGQVVAQLGMTWGVSLSLASNAAILNLMIPVMSAVLASVMLHERLTPLRIACLGLGLAGAYILSLADVRGSSFLQSEYLNGNLLILAGCLGSSFYNVYCKGLLARFSELDILIFSYMTAALASLPLLAIEQVDWGAMLHLSGEQWAAFAFLAVFHYGASMLLFFYVLEHVSVTAASTSLYLVPLFGVPIAMIVAHESLSPLTIVGTAIVLAATIAVMRYDRPSN